MPINWTSSSDKHGIPHEDALYAISNATGTQPTRSTIPGWTATVYVGHPHAQTDRYIEVIVATRPPRDMTIFHVMPLSDLYRHLAS